jgi:hypothetical protein
MDSHFILKNYSVFIERRINNRLIKHAEVNELLTALPSEFTVETKGYSEEGRSIKLVTWGKGSQKIFIWSQMHGDEATGTMALFDLMNFLKGNVNTDSITTLSESCTLYLLPVLNPDGAERFTRRNARQVDINRDYRELLSAEAKILESVHKELKPHFAFNLHDQNTLWSVEGSKKSATLSFLAPSYDANLSINDTRTKAMQVIAGMYEILTEILPGRIGLFPDDFEPRAFGDNFQLAGTSTILLEAGGYKYDFEKQEIRKYYLLSILQGLISISSRTYLNNNINSYLNIPKNGKQIFHVLIHNVEVNGLKTSVAMNFEETLKPLDHALLKLFYIHDIGDLRGYNAYMTYDTPELKIEEPIAIDSLANFSLLNNGKIVLSFTNGILKQIP